jgi:CRP-like cAMP-binding protein
LLSFRIQNQFCERRRLFKFIRDSSGMYDVLRSFLTSQIDIADSDLDAFFSKLKLKKLKRNEVLLEAGSICRHMYFVNKGCLRVYLSDASGRESTRFLIPERRFGTAFPSFILQEPSQAGIQALEQSEVLCLTYPDFRQLPELLPQWEKIYMRSLEHDYIMSIKRIESLITMDAKERYALLMKDSPELVRRLPSKIIADYLGMSQETLSRLKSKV